MPNEPIDNEKILNDEIEKTRLQSLVDTILDTIVDGVITIDNNGNIHSYNKACVDLFGYEPSEVIGRNVHMLMPSPYREEHDTYLNNYKTTKKAKIIGIGREVVGQKKDGRTFPMELAVGATTHNQESAFVGIIRDITDRREAELEREQLRQSQKMEALGQLTGGIAHDFNNLLAIMLGNLDFLMDKMEDSTLIHDFLVPCMEAAERGAELTQMLLAFGRKQALRPQVTEINLLIDGFIRLVMRTLGERMKITMVGGKDLWPCHIDYRQLENALLNLAINARDAMPHGGSITLETKNIVLENENFIEMEKPVSGDYVMVSVSDTGVGMSPDIVKKAFEPFFTTKSSLKGTGLGLSMVYGFVKQSHGHVQIYSELGYGTTVKMFLPRFDEELKSSIPLVENKHHHINNVADINILVVEDNEDVLKVTSSIVEQLGYSYLIATSGEEALKILHTRTDINFLLTDVMLSGEMNGPDLAKIATDIIPDIKVLFNSGYAEHAIFQSGILPESVHLLSKPFRKSDLANKIIEVLSADN